MKTLLLLLSIVSAQAFSIDPCTDTERFVPNEWMIILGESVVPGSGEYTQLTTALEGGIFKLITAYSFGIWHVRFEIPKGTAIYPEYKADVLSEIMAIEGVELSCNQIATGSPRMGAGN